MPRKRKLSNFADRCRFCLSRDAYTSDLFVDWLKPKLQDFEKCCSVEVLDKPNYPRSICYVCLYKLEMWSEFKSQFLATNKRLLTHFKCIELPEEKKLNSSLKSHDDTDHISDTNNQKRLKIDNKDPIPMDTTNTQIEKIIVETTFTESVEVPLNVESAENALSDTLHGLNKDENSAASVIRNQPSDCSVTTGRKSGGRSRKIEREASTKRWVERKNALIAATGEVPSESDSDIGSQLSPVQKARAKSNSEKELENKKRKIFKALKNLETNMTEKYRVKQEDIIDVERKTRSRRTNVEDLQVKEAKVEITRPLQNNKLEHPKVDIKEKDKKNDIKESLKSPSKDSEKKSVNNIQIEQQSVNNIEAEKQPTIINETDNQFKISKSKEQTEVLENNIETVDVDKNIKDNDHTQDDTEKNPDDTICPQLVTSEVSIGNATYIVTTTLDAHNSTSSKGDISLKTNGINIDVTSHDGKKIDLMNAIQLQQVQSQDVDELSIEPSNDKSAAESDIQKCLKINIEGMEMETLQRVQLELAHFIKEEIRQRVIDEALVEQIPTNLNDTNKTLDLQLKNIIEKVLRINYEAEMQSGSNWSINNKNISFAFIKAARNSSVFQPKVRISRLDVGKLCKTYKINNLHILEHAKRQRGLVGPLSRTLGKRKHVLPKKYEGFSLSLRPEDEGKTVTMAAKVIQSKPSTPIPVAPPKDAEITSNISFNKSQLSMDYEVEDVSPINVGLVESTKTVEEHALNVISSVKPPSTMTEKSFVESPDVTVEQTIKSVPIVERSVTTKPIIEKSVKAIPVIERSVKTTPVIERSVKTSPIVIERSVKTTPTVIERSIKTTPTVIEKSVKNTPTVVERSVKSTPTAFVSKPVKATSIIVEKSVKTTPAVIEKSIKTSVQKTIQSTPEVIEKSVVSLPNMTELPVIKPITKVNSIKQPSQTILTKMVVNSNKGTVLPLPSIANRSTSTTVNSKSLINKVQATASNLSMLSPVKKSILKSNYTKTNSNVKAIKRQRHICGICAQELFSKEEAEMHVKNHTMESKPIEKSPISTDVNPTPLLQTVKPKSKLMRCKRCQAIVEARNVKTHVCDSVKYNCRLCDCSFGAEHLLVAHLETHTQFKEKPNAVKSIAASPTKKDINKDTQRLIVLNENNKQLQEHNQDEDLEEMLSEKDPQGYSCFVCDKVFVDEEQMKDHLQMHCEEVSDESNEKGFQCAFCGEKFQTEESLETHVGNHLLEDGDEKINMLISMETMRDKQKKIVYRCDQCYETFSSSLQLAMHLPIHEEEEAATMIAEYEKQQQQDADQDHHVCTICDEIFDTPEELSEHQDVHNGNAHVCILCEKPFSSIRDLQEHVSTHL